MNKIIKLIAMLSLINLISSCSIFPPVPIYQSKGKTSDLMIDVPNEYEQSLSILVFEKERDFFSTNGSLLYGHHQSRIQNNNHVKVATNKKLFLHIHYDVNLDEYCDSDIKFTPNTGKVYRLTIGTSLDDNKHEKCYVAVAELINGKLIPINLSQK